MPYQTKAEILVRELWAKRPDLDPVLRDIVQHVSEVFELEPSHAIRLKSGDRSKFAQSNKHMDIELGLDAIKNWVVWDLIHEYGHSLQPFPPDGYTPVWGDPVTCHREATAWIIGWNAIVEAGKGAILVPRSLDYWACAHDRLKHGYGCIP